MLRPSVKLIAAIAIAVTFSLAPLALAQKPAPCANATLGLTRTVINPDGSTAQLAINSGDVVNSNDEVVAAALVTNCGKSAKFTVQYVVTDSCGNRFDLPVTTLMRLREGGSDKALATLLAGQTSCLNGSVTVTANVMMSDGKVSDGTVLASPSMSFTVAP